MGMFIRVTLAVAALIVGFAALLLVLKLLVFAAIIAAVVIAVGFLLRALGVRIGSRRRWVTTLTARR